MSFRLCQSGLRLQSPIFCEVVKELVERPTINFVRVDNDPIGPPLQSTMAVFIEIGRTTDHEESVKFDVTATEAISCAERRKNGSTSDRSESSLFASNSSRNCASSSRHFASSNDID